MGDFDPRNPPAWVRRLMSRAQRAPGREPGAGGARGDREHGSDRDFVSLGHGTFVAPLPAGWTLHPGRPFQGRIRARDGWYPRVFDAKLRDDGALLVNAGRSRGFAFRQ